VNLREIYMALGTVGIPLAFATAAFVVMLGVRWWKNVPRHHKLAEAGILALLVSLFCVGSLIMGQGTRVCIVVGIEALMVGLFIRAKELELPSGKEKK
jgi:hypothetical protein